MAIGAPIAAAAIAAGATVYAASTAKGPQAPAQAPNVPILPTTASTAATMQQSQLAAQTAGGTITSDPNKDKQQGIIGGPLNTGQKTLLGT
jgi:hypothetical protein